jgi:hypothetical protein
MLEKIAQNAHQEKEPKRTGQEVVLDPVERRFKLRIQFKSKSKIQFRFNSEDPDQVQY